MDFESFLAKYGQSIVIDARSFIAEKKPAYLRKQVTNWVKKCWLIKLKKGIYLPANLEKAYSKFYIANQLYFPSYVSLESALSFYGLIPEEVFAITSISTNKTISFKNDLGEFKYHSVKPDLFFGFMQISQKEQPIHLATKEKALLDYLYFNQHKYNDGSEVVESLRLNMNIKISRQKCLEFCKKYNSKKLQALILEILNHD